MDGSHNEQAWEDALAALHSAAFAEYLCGCRWYGGKAQKLRGVEVLEVLSLGDVGRLVLIRADYEGAASETYLLALNSDDVRHDALEDEGFRAALLEVMVDEQRLRCGMGELVGSCGAEFKAQVKEMMRPLSSWLLKVEQSNSSVLYDGRFFLKLFRRPELGENPDAELLRYFSEKHPFENVPGYCGVLEHRVPGDVPRVLALMVMNVVNAGTAWTSTLSALAENGGSVGSHDLERARRLGERTAQMHLALMAEAEDPDFVPEGFSEMYRDSLRTSMTETTRRMMQLLELKLDVLPAGFRQEAAALLRREDEIRQRHAKLMQGEIHAMRIRIHGDYHLGQVLDAGDDFVIIDFEGEPARSLSERRIKHSPLRDVASMLRSFDYAAHTVMGQQGGVDLEEWTERVSAEFLNAYLRTAEGASFLPADDRELRMLLEVCLLEKAVYEVCYELNNRPDWAVIPLRGMLRILGRAGAR